MAGRWNMFNREEQHVDVEAKPNSEVKLQEKTQAELIAESLNEFKTSVSTQLGAFQTKLDEVSASTKRPEPNKAEPAAGVNEPPSVFDNEEAAFATRIGPVVAMQLETQARLTRGEIKQEYVAKGWGEVWLTNEVEINQILDGSPLLGGNGKPVRGDAVYIRNVVDMVIGRAAQKAGLKFGGKDRGFFVETAGGDSGNVGAGPVNDGLTADQRRVFSRMKVKPEEAAKTMSKLKFIN